MSTTSEIIEQTLDAHGNPTMVTVIDPEWGGIDRGFSIIRNRSLVNSAIMAEDLSVRPRRLYPSGILDFEIRVSQVRMGSHDWNMLMLPVSAGNHDLEISRSVRGTLERAMVCVATGSLMTSSSEFRRSGDMVTLSELVIIASGMLLPIRRRRRRVSTTTQSVSQVSPTLQVLGHRLLAYAPTVGNLLNLNESWPPGYEVNVFEPGHNQIELCLSNGVMNVEIITVDRATYETATRTSAYITPFTWCQLRMSCTQPATIVYRDYGTVGEGVGVSEVQSAPSAPRRLVDLTAGDADDSS